jgi:hypothetical protein
MPDPADLTDDVYVCLRCREEPALEGLPVGRACEPDYQGDSRLRLLVDLLADGWSLEEARTHRDLQGDDGQRVCDELLRRWQSAPSSGPRFP